MKKQTLNFDKLKAAVHYVCEKASNPDCLGSIKLNKVLLYADQYSYLVRGRSITGETYIKRQFGPVPKHILAVREALQEEGKIKRGRAAFFSHIKDEFISISDPDLTMFDGEEISYIDQAFEHVCLKNTATSISEETHDDIWRMAEIGEELPLSTVFASRLEEIDEEDVEWARDGVV